MQLQNIPIENSIGAILVHNVAGADGRKALSKGRVIRLEDVEILRALAKATVYAAILDPTDVREDDAAARLARSAAGEAVETGKPSGGRVNLYAAKPGFLRIDVERLKKINALTGITLATIARYAPAAPKKMIATLKTVGLALPESVLREAERIGAVLSVTGVINKNVAILLTGSENGRLKTQETFSPPIQARVQELGGLVIAEDYIPEDADAMSRAIQSAIRKGAQLIVIAGETSIMDAEDTTPRGIENAGGKIELFGAPVEPGNLLLLAYRDAVPIVGAPGCIKSRETNVVDLILPRLLIGERVTRADVIDLAVGGLLIG